MTIVWCKEFGISWSETEGRTSQGGSSCQLNGKKRSLCRTFPHIASVLQLKTHLVGLIKAQRSIAIGGLGRAAARNLDSILVIRESINRQEVAVFRARVAAKGGDNLINALESPP